MEDYEADYIEKANLEARLHNAEIMIQNMGRILGDILPPDSSRELCSILFQHFDASEKRGAFKDVKFK